jgi:competence protein ComEC
LFVYRPSRNRSSNTLGKIRINFKEAQKQYASNSCKAALMDNGTSLVEALLYGKLDGLTSETIFLFARTGLIHLFSASGFHMGAALMLAAGTAKVLGPAIPGRWKVGFAFAISLMLMTFFGQATEWSSPLVRAYAFTTLLAGAKVAEVRPGKAWVFTLSLLAAALLGRGSLLSFSLSALGMAGVLLVGGQNPLLLAVGPWLFTTPLVVWSFGLFSLASPLWNLTIGMLVSWLVLPPAIVGLVLEAVGISAKIPFALAASLMEIFTAWLAKGDALVGGAYWVGKEKFFFTAVALSLAWWLYSREKKTGAILATSLSLIPLLFPSVKLAALDVGQGDAIFARLESGETLMIDAGPPGWKKFPALVNKSFEQNALPKVDHLLLTHADRDHIGGAPDFLLRHPVKKAIWIRREALNDPRMLPVLGAAERARVKIKILAPENSPPAIRCWFPPPITSNEGSPLCHARLAGGKSVWLTGDAGFASERWLLAQSGNLPKADFLKVGHHGSRGSSSQDFITATGASVAIVNVGKNRYGHPSPEALRRLESAGIAVLRTDLNGSLIYH